MSTGDLKRVLVEEAEGWGADCISVGSTGFSVLAWPGRSRPVMGATPASLSRVAKVWRRPRKVKPSSPAAAE